MRCGQASCRGCHAAAQELCREGVLARSGVSPALLPSVLHKLAVFHTRVARNSSSARTVASARCSGTMRRTNEACCSTCAGFASDPEPVRCSVGDGTGILAAHGRPRPHAQGTPATQGFRTIRAWGRPVRHGLRAAGPNRLEARIHVPSAYDPQRCRTALSGRRCSCGGGGRGMARDPFPHST